MVVSVISLSPDLKCASAGLIRRGAGIFLALRLPATWTEAKGGDTH